MAILQANTVHSAEPSQSARKVAILRAVHQLLDAPVIFADPVANDTTYPGGSASGFDPYFLLELGAQWSVGHVLLGVELVTLIDGASSLNKSQLEGATKAFGNTNTLPLFGLSIHAGFSRW